MQFCDWVVMPSRLSCAKAPIAESRYCLDHTLLSLRQENAALKAVLHDIAGGHISKANDGHDVLELSMNEFRHAMWGWSQKMARAALGQAEKKGTGIG